MNKEENKGLNQCLNLDTANWPYFNDWIVKRQLDISTYAYVAWIYLYLYLYPYYVPT